MQIDWPGSLQIRRRAVKSIMVTTRSQRRRSFEDAGEVALELNRKVTGVKKEEVPIPPPIESSDSDSADESSEEEVDEVDAFEKPKLNVSLVQGLLDNRKECVREEKLKREWSKAGGGEELKKIQVEEEPERGLKPSGREEQIRKRKLAVRQEDRELQSLWFEMKTPELTQDVKDDLRLVQLRNFIDPKRFYKANDRKGLPSVFQIGTVVAGPADDRFSRLTRKEKRGRFAEELLADDKVTRYAKRVYKDIQQSKANRGKKFYAKRRNKSKGKGKGR